MKQDGREVRLERPVGTTRSRHRHGVREPGFESRQGDERTGTVLGAGQQSAGTVVSAGVSRLLVEDRDAGRVAVDRLGGLDRTRQDETRDQDDQHVQDRERRMALPSVVRSRHLPDP